MANRMPVSEIILILLASILLSAPASAQVFDLGPSDSGLFDNVINLPPNPDIGNNASVGGVEGQTTQLNVAEGGLVGVSLDANVGAEVNICGGSVGPTFNARFGSELNMSSGSLGGSVLTLAGSVLNISGGEVGIFLNVVGGDVNISGGSVGDLFLIEAGSVVNISGGTIGNGFSALNGSCVNIRGGTFGDNFDVSNGGQLNLFGSEFILNGKALDDLVSDTPFTILDRNVTLTCRLVDGSMFSYDLNSNDTSSDDFLSPDGTLTVTLATAVLGDVNRDGDVNLLDVGPFVELLGSGGFQVEADTNQDGFTNLLDVDSFIALLSGGP